MRRCSFARHREHHFGGMPWIGQVWTTRAHSDASASHFGSVLLYDSSILLFVVILSSCTIFPLHFISNSTIDPTCSSCFLSSKCFAIDTNRLTRLCVATIAQSYRYMYATAYYYNGTSLLDEIIEANSNNHKLVIPTRCCDLICF